MNKVAAGMLLVALAFCGKAFAVGVDVGPVHVHTEGSIQMLNIVVDTIVKDKDGTVTKLNAHRKGGEDTFAVKVVLADLDDKSRDLVKTNLKTGVTYKANIEKLEDNWKLLKLSVNDDD